MPHKRNKQNAKDKNQLKKLKIYEDQMGILKNKIETYDGSLIFPPGFMLNPKREELSPYETLIPDPRKLVFPDDPYDAVLIVVEKANTHALAAIFKSKCRPLVLYGDKGSPAEVVNKFDGEVAMSTHKSRAQNLETGKRISVVVLAKSREMSSIYPGDPVVKCNAQGKMMHSCGQTMASPFVVK